MLTTSWKSVSAGRLSGSGPHCRGLHASPRLARIAASARELAQSSDQDGARSPAPCTSRRSGLLSLIAAIAASGTPAHADDAAPGDSPASRALPAIRSDFVDKQYYVTGNVSRGLFADDCTFIDPTTTVTGVDRYLAALQALFDPATSRADLISLEATGPRTLLLRWRLEGKLKIGGLAIKPYTGSTVYTLGEDGRVVRHEETWDISALDAFVSTLIPGFGAPPAPPVAR